MAEFLFWFSLGVKFFASKWPPAWRPRGRLLLVASHVREINIRERSLSAGPWSYGAVPIDRTPAPRSQTQRDWTNVDDFSEL